jgi:hypothetical protein
MIQYILYAFTFSFIVVYVYIKLTYPFWNNQPVFHTYDYWRYFYSVPFVVYKHRPVKTKFCDFQQIKTTAYLDAGEEQTDNIKDLLQCYYFDTDRILHTIQSNDINAYLTGHSEPAYISVYNEPTYQIVDLSSIEIISSTKPFGCITSRPMHLFYRPTLNESVYTRMPVYYIDFLCVHRDKNKEKERKKINRALLQTHEYNQCMQNPSIVVSLIKKEIDLIEGVIPLVEYKTYTFYLRNIHFPKLPPHFELIQINSENYDILFDFLHLKQKLEFDTNMVGLLDIMMIPDIGNITSLIKQSLLFVYCLRKEKDIYGIYFIKDVKMQYDDIEGNTLQCIGSVNQMVNSSRLFYLGFLHGLHQIIHKNPEYKMLLLEDIGHNTILLNFWRRKHTPVFVNKTAYYLYNFIYPRSPLSKEKCFILQ